MDFPKYSRTRCGYWFRRAESPLSRPSKWPTAALLSFVFSMASAKLRAGDVIYTNPGKTVRIEQSSDGLFVVQTSNERQRARLVSGGEPPDEFHFSPDGAWLYALRHVGSGLRAGDLFQQASPTSITPHPDFDDLAWKNAAKLGAVQHNFSADGLYAMASFGGWSIDSKHLLIGLRGGEKKGSLRGGYIYFNTQTKTFELTDYLRKFARAASPELGCAEPVDPLPSGKELAARFETVDQRLNQAYQERTAKLDRYRASNLRDAQRTWLKQREEGLKLYLSLASPAAKERRRLQFLGDVTAARLDDFTRPIDEDL